MKKLLALLLVSVLFFSLVACGDDPVDDESKSDVSTSDVSSGDTDESISEDDESVEDSVDDSKEESDEISEDDEESGDVSDDVSKDESEDDDDETMPAFTNKFISFADAVGVAARATDSTSIRLTKVNETAKNGDVVLFTRKFGANIASGKETYEDFAVLVATYDHSEFGYKKTAFYPVGADDKKKATKIPADGFVVVVSKAQETEIAHLGNIEDTHKFHVHGIQVTEIAIDLAKTKKAPTIDGNISSSEYGKAKWVVNEKNVLWDYSQFEKDNYYATAEIYMTYDDTNLYLGVIVDSPFHYNPVEQSNASSMYQYECIQVNLSSEDPTGSYMSEHFDHVLVGTAVNEGVVRQYGFAANDNKDTVSVVWMGIDKTFTGETVCLRDDTLEKTFYEVSIPWSELGSTDKPFDVKKAKTVGVSVSINSTNKEDIDAGRWKNIKLRDGGGIIGRNDFSKMARVNLK